MPALRHTGYRLSQLSPLAEEAAAASYGFLYYADSFRQRAMPLEVAIDPRHELMSRQE
jgi:hypothetical protein